MTVFLNILVAVVAVHLNRLLAKLLGSVLFITKQISRPT